MVLEALACGKFVITTKVGALESIINSSVGYTVNMKNEVEICAMLSVVIAHSRDAWCAAHLLGVESRFF